jgi:hypothetical protein
MSSIIVGETYDLLLKMVVIGGKIVLIQTLVWARPTFYQDFKEISSAYNQSLRLESNSQLKLSRFRVIR